MSFKRDKKSLKKEEIKSMENAVKDAGIGAIHPDKMEEWAEHLVRKLVEDQRSMLNQFTVILNSDGTFNIMVDDNLVQTNLPASELSQVAMEFRESVTNMMLAGDIVND